MNQEIIDFLNTERVGVLALEMPDGSPHASTVHFAYADGLFYFETNRDYRKSEALFSRTESRASFVVGLSETVMKTIQLDGIARLVTPAELLKLKEVYLGRFPEKVKRSDDPKTVFFTFTPTWWRFTDWTAPEGKRIVTSA